jgi:lysozyme family protein
VTAVDQIIDDVLRREGTFVNDAADLGGPTMRGITATTLARWRQAPVTLADIQALTEAEARDIYRHLYVEAPGFAEAIPNERLLALVVDFGVLSGPVVATKALQRAIGVLDDGVLGPKTRRVLAAQAGSLDVYNRLLAERIGHHVRIVLLNPSQRRFLDGWLTRLVSFL